ncbi:MAG: glycosyltransferase, partial [Rhodospirillaceae bacterium]|nr:glycosyltransferase [Rhodospirillaceae bacterium]
SAPDVEDTGTYRILRYVRPRFVSRRLLAEFAAAAAQGLAACPALLVLVLALPLLLAAALCETAIRLLGLLGRRVLSCMPWHSMRAWRLLRQASASFRSRGPAVGPGAAAARPGWTQRWRMLAAAMRHVLVTTDVFWRAGVGDSLDTAVIYCNDLDTALAGLLLRRAFPGSVIIYDSHEYWPYGNVEALRLQVRIFRAFDRFFMRRADHVLTVSDPLAREMERAYGVSSIHVVPNAEPWIERPWREAQPGEIDRLAAGRVRFLFQGNFAPQRGLEEILEAWAAVDQGKAALFLRGPRSPWRDALQRRAEALGLLGRSVFVLPPVSVDDLVHGAGEADVGIIPYRGDLPAYRFACPNKLSQYLHAGLAILGNNIPYVAQQIAAGRCGLVYDVADPASIVDAVDSLARDRDVLRQYQRNALGYGRTVFNWQVQSAPLRAILEEISLGRETGR